MTRTTLAALAFAAGLLVGLVAGTFGGRAASTTERPTSELARPRAPERGGATGPRLEPPRPRPDLAPTATPSNATTASGKRPDLRANGSSGGAIANQTHDAAHGDDEAHGGGAIVDAETLAAATRRFRETTEPGELEELAALLGASGGAEASALALEALRSSGSTPLDLARRAAAFEILAAQENPAGRAPALEALARERDESVRRAALDALGSARNASVDEARATAAELARVLERDADADSRRRAARALVRWRRSDEDLGPLLNALARDPDPEVRGACAFAIEDERIRTPAAVAALANVVADGSAPPSVRELAAEALGTLGPLDATTRATLERWRQERSGAPR